MYQSKYYTCEEIDERLLKGYYDDVVSKGYTGTLEQFQHELASIGIIDYLVPNAYVICDTASEIKDKTITVEGYHNIPAHGGGSIKVKFVHDNTAENPTLDISGTGAKPLYLGKDPVSPTNTWADGSIVEVFYDGENYRILSDQISDMNKLSTIEPGAQVNHTLVLDGEESDLDVSDEEGNVILRLKEGEIQTKKFNSRNIGNPALFDSSKTYAVGDYVTYGNLFCKFTAEHTGEWNDDDVEYITIMEYVKEMVSKVEHPVSITDGGDLDLDISDEEGNVIARFSGGEFQTKNFDSMKTPAQMDDNGAADFQIADEEGNVILCLKDGHIQVKHFNSRDTTTNSNYAERPANGYEFFTVNVDIAIEDSEDSNETSTSVINKCNFSIENGRIDIPICYTSNGNPTKLVIYNHGAGGQVGPGIATELEASFGPLKNELLNRGYAILQMDGMPNLLKNSEYVYLSSNCGGPQYIKCITKGYEYAISKYNLAKDGVVILGASMGGLCSLNLYNSGLLPIKAICLDAPVIDLYHDAYFSSWITKVPLSIAYLYNWKNCDFSNGTYTLDGITYKPLSSISQSDKIELWNLNKSKVTAFNPYINGHFLVKNLDGNYFNNTTDDNDQNYYGIHIRAPLMIWFGNGDTVNQPNIGRKFIQILRNGGSIAYFRTYPTSHHCVWNIQTCVTETLNFIDKYK